MSTNGGIFMSINLISLKCPECGATLQVEEDCKECFCSYFGNRVIVQNDNEKTVNINKHIVDEAEIKRVENEAKTNDYKLSLIVLSIFMAFVIFMVILFYFFT